MRLSKQHPNLIYQPRADSNPEAERDTLAQVYRFILESHASKQAVPPDGPDDAKGKKRDRAEKEIIPAP